MDESFTYQELRAALDWLGYTLHRCPKCGGVLLFDFYGDAQCVSCKPSPFYDGEDEEEE